MGYVRWLHERSLLACPWNAESKNSRKAMLMQLRAHVMDN
jgi:hypothetical protein